MRAQCDMDYDCKSHVTHIDEKGFAYCTSHGRERRYYRRCRALRPWERRILESGRGLLSYKPITLAEHTRLVKAQETPAKASEASE
jgi:hypothetical protein